MGQRLYFHKGDEEYYSYEVDENFMGIEGTEIIESKETYFEGRKKSAGKDNAFGETKNGKEMKGRVELNPQEEENGS